MIELIKKTPKSLINDILSGLTVALALVPEAVAFSFVAGVDPLVGLYAAFMVGLITATFGGRPGMISGATGALAVVMVTLVAENGVEYLFATVVLMGIIQLSAGVLDLGKFSRIIPHPVMLGFVNGLAIVIFLAQLSQFKFIDDLGVSHWLHTPQMLIMAVLVIITMLIIHFLPRLTKAVPSTLAAIITISIIVFIFNIDTRTVGDMASVGGGLPSFSFPSVPLNFETLSIIFPYAIILAAIGLIESLMTLQLVDEITETRGDVKRECIGQGSANIVTGFFGGMGGCAMIGQSMINVNSGGRGRASGISAALFLLSFILVGSSLIEKIPLAALVGVMFLVVIGTFEWSSIRILGKIPKSDSFIIILVSGVTVATDLAIAVACGIIASALVFVWKRSETIFSNDYTDDEGKHYLIEGSLFFGSVKSFIELFDAKNDPDTIYMDFTRSRVCDASSIEAINSVVERYRAQDKMVYVKNLSPDCASVIKKAGKLFEGEVIH